MAKTSKHSNDEKRAEQHTDKDRAQKENETEPGHMPPQRIRREGDPTKGED